MKKLIVKNIWRLIVSSLVTLLPSIVAALLWGVFSDRFTEHFGGAAGAEILLSMMAFVPVFLLVLNLAAVLITLWDSMKHPQSEKVLGIIFWICPAISIYAFSMIGCIACGLNISAYNFVCVLLGILFVILGNYMPKCKQNFTIGIKIKWTLANQANWTATHRIAGFVWFIFGMVCLVLGLLPASEIGFILLIVLTIAVAIIPAVYSYIFYRRQIKSGEATEDDYSVDADLKYSKTTVIVVSILIGCLLIFVAGVMFFGDVSVKYGDESFTVSASLSGSLTVDYSDVESLEYVQKDDVGTRLVGVASARLLAGSFRSDTYGIYTRYTYTGAESAVVIKLTDGSTVVVNGIDAAATEAIYAEIQKKLD